MKRILPTLSLILLIALSACGSQPTPAAPTALPEPTATVEVPTLEPTVVPTAAPAFEALTYKDEAAGFAFDYPKTWMLEKVKFGERASGLQLTSWAHEAGQLPAEIPAGGSIMDVMIQLWDPKNDLQAFTEQHKTAWDASSIKILSEEDLTLSGGRAAKQFVVQGSDGAQGYFLLTTLGQDYLVFSGSGDLTLLGQIAQTVR
jgi:hypothetical protein